MKKLRILLLGLVLSTASIGLVVMPTACTTSAKRVAYNTLYSVEVSTTTVHDTFLDEVVKGNVKTNGVPDVAKAYNKFQAGMSAAIATAQFNWQAPASAELTALGLTVLDAIRQAKGH